MTKISVIKDFGGGLVSNLKKKISILTVDDFNKPKYNYPLYWLAPAIDRGTKRMKISSIFKGAPKCEGDSNLFHISGTSGLVKLVLSFVGMGPRKGKDSPIQLVRIEGRYIVERGQHLVRLAALLNLDYVPVKVVEYDYSSLKKRMHVFMYPNGSIVGVPGGEKGVYNYYGIYPAQLEALVRCHNVPCEDTTAAIVRKPAAGMARGGGSLSCGMVKYSSNVVLFKK